MGALVDFLKEYQNNPLQIHGLPSKITDRYFVCACLKETVSKQVYLIRRNSDGKKCILKCLSCASQENLKEEYNLHHDLSHIGLVAAIEYMEDDQYRYFIREYIEGNTITELLEMTKTGYLTDTQIINIIEQLCQVLYYLHRQKPPIIHRDIKPDNIILTKEGTLKLIDFGISRRFSGEQGKDTVIMGTQYMAPPEQFGFQQTDARSDIYSLGVLMFYMATGCMDIREFNEFTINRSIRKCIQKCTKFSPEDRYENVRQVEAFVHRDTLISRYHKSLLIMGIVTAVILAFLVGFLLSYHYFAGKTGTPSTDSGSDLTSNVTLQDAASDDSAGGQEYEDQAGTTDIGIQSFDTMGVAVSDQSQPMNLQDTDEYQFTSELIEEAVRQQLNKSDTDIITVAELKQIKELFICGKQIYHIWGEHYVYGSGQHMHGEEYNESGLYEVRGDIKSLEDIKYMTNLRILALYNQNISDISPLKDLTALTKLGLGANGIEDISALSGLKELETLDVSGNNIDNEDLKITKEFPNLEELDLGSTLVTSLQEIKDIKLKYLSIYGSYLYDCAGLEEMTSLRNFVTTGLNHTITEDAFQRIASLPELRELHVMSGETIDFSLISKITTLYLLDLCSVEAVNLEELNNPYLENLNMNEIPELDLSGIEKNKELKYLTIHNSDVDDFTPLQKLPKLIDMRVDSELLLQMQKQLGDIMFHVTVFD